MGEQLIGLILYALIVALIAFLVSMLLRTRLGALGYVGAGFLGHEFGAWLLSLAKVTDPLVVDLPGTYSVGVVGALLGTLIVVLIFRLVGRGVGRGRRI